MTLVKSAILGFGCAALIIGTVAEVKARLASHHAETAIFDSSTHTAGYLAEGQAQCMTVNTMRLYSRAVVEGRTDYANAMINRQICMPLPHSYAYELLETVDEFAKVKVVLDDTEYQFWVEQETLQ